jgi:hypothetical protein
VLKLVSVLLPMVDVGQHLIANFAVAGDEIVNPAH